MLSKAQRVPWTQDQVDLLKKLWSEGVIAYKIAEKLGPDFTRNMVIGKARRLGLGLSVYTKSRQPGKRERNMAPKPKAQYSRVRTPPIKVVPQPVGPHDLSQTVSIWDAGPNHCRAIIEGFGANVRFCGGKTLKGLSWCSHHASIYFNPPQARVRRS